MSTPLRLIPHLHRATHQVGLHLDRRREELDVSQGEAHVLAHLAEHGDCSIGALHRSFGHKRSTLTSILNRLEQRGVIVREVHPDDRRSYLLKLTRTGKPLASRVHATLVALERAASSSVTRAQLDGFLAVVAALEAAADDD